MLNLTAHSKFLLEQSQPSDILSIDLSLMPQTPDYIIGWIYGNCIILLDLNNYFKLEIKKINIDYLLNCKYVQRININSII